MIENVTIETSIVEGKTRAADAPRAERAREALRCQGTDSPHSLIGATYGDSERRGLLNSRKVSIRSAAFFGALDQSKLFEPL